MSQKPTTAPGLMDNLMGAMDIMLGRESGLQRMDLSANGFTWSFAGLLLVVLVDMSALSAMYNAMGMSGTGVSVSKPGFIGGTLIAGGLGYLAAMLALYLLCREPEEQVRFPTAVITHNWAAPVVSVATLPVLIAITQNATAQPSDGNAIWALLQMVMIALLILVGVRLIRISLNVTLFKACLFFSATAAVSVVCRLGLERLMGLQQLAV